MTATTTRGTTAAAAVAVTLAAAAACWVVSVRQMTGMNMGVATDVGSFASFAGLWMSMMAAMMLPGAVLAVARQVRADRSVLAAPLFDVSYLAVWALVGVIAYAVYRPHGTSLAGALVIAAGLYELTPVKRNARRHCREHVRSGFEFGIYCVGSSIGLMVVLVAVGVMSIAWMVVIAVIVAGQKLVPPKAVLDVALAIAIVGFGIWIVIAPSAVPGLMPAM